MVKRTVFTSCIDAKELALTRRGSNPGSFALVTRAAPDADPIIENATETTDMAEAADIARAITAALSMDDVTRAHYLSLGDDEKVAFIARTADEQKAEATEAKRKVDEAAAADAARATGATEREIELQRRLDDKDKRLAVLEAKDAERGIVDAARHADFVGYPGGEDKVVEQLRAMKDLPQATQDILRSNLVNTAKMARDTTRNYGHSEVTDVSRSEADAARARIDAKAKEVSVARSIPLADAWERVTEMAEFAADVAAVNAVN